MYGGGRYLEFAGKSALRKKTVIKKKFHGSWSVTKISKKYHPNKILINKKKFLCLHNVEGLKFVSRQLLNDIFIRNGIFYIFSIKELEKQKTIYLKKLNLAETYYKTVNIDTAEDLKEARKLL